MAQLRQDYPAFVQQEAEVVIVGPDGPDAFKRYWQKEDLPFIGLANPDHSVAKLYGQQVRVLKLGRMPAMAVIDKLGRVHYQHHGNSMRDIPTNERILRLLDDINQQVNTNRQVEHIVEHDKD
ncbi:MAG: peroxiredoxin family protein [Chloroflexi bacterium]|nr:peroxiredoxin family protein [Chloroflexota bacterium]